MALAFTRNRVVRASWIGENQIVMKEFSSNGKDLGRIKEYQLRVVYNSIVAGSEA
jgi:hypothetical protein